MKADMKADKSVKLSNVPSMAVEKLVNVLSQSYSTVIQNGLSVRTVPSVMLWGPPGIGKSQAVREIAAEIEESTGKEVRVTDVRLLLFNPIDLRGIPTSNADKTLAVWLKPKIFQMDPSEDIVNILFLDEISAAPQSVQAAAYQITLDRVVGEHRLPDNCIVITGPRISPWHTRCRRPWQTVCSISKWWEALRSGSTGRSAPGSIRRLSDFCPSARSI